MSESLTLRKVGAESVFDTARRQLTEWERSDPRAAHIVLILEGHTDVVVTVAGEDISPSAAAGLCFTAATLAVEE